MAAAHRRAPGARVRVTGMVQPRLRDVHWIDVDTATDEPGERDQRRRHRRKGVASVVPSQNANDARGFARLFCLAGICLLHPTGTMGM